MPNTEMVKHVAHFEVIEEIGAGGMGVVYRARDKKLDRTVALKFLSPEHSSRADARERQIREARAAAALNHPNIATIYEIADADQGHLIAMEFVDGKRLYDLVRGAHVDLDQLTTWTVQICEAIQAAHDIGIIHRDIKSTNIMVTADGRAKVLDFGLALRNPIPGSKGKSSEVNRITEAGAIVGTVDYLAPEILRGEEATAASDVFSLGVMMYEMITGQLPFQAAAEVQVMYMIAHLEPEPMAKFRQGVPEWLIQVVGKAMEKDPSQRYQSARDVLNDLRRNSERDTPSPRTYKPEATTSNLPSTSTVFVGKNDELQELERLLESHSLITVTGPGGAGKTRLSLELANRCADRFPGGMHLVEVARLDSADSLLAAIAHELGIRERPSQFSLEAMNERFAGQPVLLILDNCEHLVEACAQVADQIVETWSEITLIATSQERLAVPSEVVWQLSTLSLPAEGATTPDAVEASESGQLFLDRARRVNQNFRLDERNAKFVAQICRRLDGIPLAIELAATRVRVLSAEQILKRLEDRFQLLTGGSRAGLPRQQTLRATVEWSLDLLTPGERQLFMMLSTFSGSMCLDAIEHLCSGECHDEDVIELLGRLVDKSLVLMSEDTEQPRYRMLQTLLEYGRKELAASGRAQELRDRHAAYYIQLAERAGPELTGPVQAKWFDELNDEQDNFAAAIRWLIHRGEARSALAICASVWRFWFVRGHLGAGRKLIDEALAACSDCPDLRAAALQGAGVLAADQGEYDVARAHYEESLRIRREIGVPEQIAQALGSLGILARDRGDYEQARSLLQECLSINSERQNAEGEAMSIHALGITEHREGNCETARTLFEQGLEIRRRLGDRRGIGALLAHLGSVDFDLGEARRAQRMLDEGLDIFRELGNKRGIVFAMLYLGGVSAANGDLESARAQHIQCLRISRDIGDKAHMLQALEWLARDAVAMDEPARAVELEAAAAALRERFGVPRTPMETTTLHATIEKAQSQVGSRIAEIHGRGRSHTFDDAFALALRR